MTLVDAENELRQSNALSDGFYNMLKGCFNSMTSDCDEDDAEDKEVENEDKE